MVYTTFCGYSMVKPAEPLDTHIKTSYGAPGDDPCLSPLFVVSVTATGWLLLETLIICGYYRSVTGILGLHRSLLFAFHIPKSNPKSQPLESNEQVAKKYNLYTKVTGGQRIDLFGAEKHQVNIGTAHPATLTVWCGSQNGRHHGDWYCICVVGRRCM